MLARIFLSLALASSTAGYAQITSFNLSNYQLSGTHALPLPGASEASAVTYNWDRNSMFVLGDEGDALVEVSKTGALLSSMSLSGFDDTEGLTYIGGGNFVLTEERLQDAYLLNYAPGGSAARSSLPWVSLGPTVGNIGIEGISYDPVTGSYFAVKENSPQAVYQAQLTFAAGAAGGTASLTSLFDPALLGVSDLSDIQALTAVPSLLGTLDQDNLLIFSQESSLLLEVTRTGTVMSTYDFSALAGDAEGVAIDFDGNIYVVGEAPEMFVLTPVPEPSAYAMLAAGLGLVGWRVRRRPAAESDAPLR